MEKHAISDTVLHLVTWTRKRDSSGEAFVSDFPGSSNGSMFESWHEQHYDIRLKNMSGRFPPPCIDGLEDFCVIVSLRITLPDHGRSVSEPSRWLITFYYLPCSTCGLTISDRGKKQELLILLSKLLFPRLSHNLLRLRFTPRRRERARGRLPFPSFG